MKVKAGSNGFLKLEEGQTSLHGFRISGVGSDRGAELEPSGATYWVTGEGLEIAEGSWVGIDRIAPIVRLVDATLSGKGVRSGEGAIVSHLEKACYVTQEEMEKISSLPHKKPKKT